MTTQGAEMRESDLIEYCNTLYRTAKSPQKMIKKPQSILTLHTKENSKPPDHSIFYFQSTF